MNIALGVLGMAACVGGCMLAMMLMGKMATMFRRDPGKPPS